MTIFVLLFSTKFFIPGSSLLKLAEFTDGLPYGWIGIVGAFQFGIGIWFYRHRGNSFSGRGMPQHGTVPAGGGL